MNGKPTGSERDEQVAAQDPDVALIRAALNFIIVSDRMSVAWKDAEDALVALDDLLAENERLRQQVNSGRALREHAEGLPEGTLPRV